MTEQQDMNPEELRRLRDTAWTEAGYLYWQRGDPPEAKRQVWTAHQRTGLDTTLLALIEAFGQPDAVAIREVKS